MQMGATTAAHGIPPRCRKSDDRHWRRATTIDRSTGVGRDGARDGQGAGSETYTLPQLAEISGIDYRTLHNWQKRGLLNPTHHRANGSGTVNLFATEDALQVVVLAELRRAGVEMRILEAAADRVRRSVGQPTADGVLVIGDEVRIVDDLRDLDSSLETSGAVLVYRLRRAQQALQLHAGNGDAG